MSTRIYVTDLECESEVELENKQFINQNHFFGNNTEIYLRAEMYATFDIMCITWG